MAVNSANAYWVNVGNASALMSVSKDGGLPTMLYDGSMDRVEVGSIFADDSAVYWSNLPLGNVMKAPAAGGPVVTLASGYVSAALSTIANVALYNGGLYWAGPPPSALPLGVSEVSIQGGPVQNIGVPLSDYTLIAVNSAGFYYPDSQYQPTIERVPLGGMAEPEAVTTLPGLSFFTQDANAIYWAWAVEGGAVGRFDADGGNAVVVQLAGTLQPGTLVVDPDGVFFVGSYFDGGVFQSGVFCMDHAGSTVTQLAAVDPGAQGIATDSSFVYWTNLSSGTVVKMPKSDGGVVIYPVDAGPDAGADAGVVDAGGVFPIASGIISGQLDFHSPGRASVGFDGQNYLVVSCSSLVAPTGLDAFFVSQDGGALQTVNLAPAVVTTNCSRVNSAVAFDGTQYLVLYDNGTLSNSSQIFGVRLLPDGTVLDPDGGFVLGPGDSVLPAVVFDGAQFFVVWDSFDSIVGRWTLVAATVASNGQVGTPLTLVSQMGGQLAPSIAFGAGEYFVSWTYSPSNQLGMYPDEDVYAARVSPSGVVLDPAGIPLCTAPGGQDATSVTFDGSQFFVVWSDGRTDPMGFTFVDTVYGARVSTDGGLLDGPAADGGIFIGPEPNPSVVSPWVAAEGGHFLVAWSINQGMAVDGARVDSSGNVLDPDGGTVLAVPRANCLSCPVYFPVLYAGPSGVLFVWNDEGDYHGPDKTIFGKLLTPY